MGKEGSMWENLNVPLQKECDDEHELSLELSLGGNYGKSEKRRNPFGEIDKGDYGILRSDGSCDKNDMGQEIGNGFLDLNKRKEIQALRRQEARKKREDKLYKSRGVNNAGGFVEDKLFLEAHKFQLRVQDRENREKEEGLLDLGRKGEKNGGVGQDLNLSLFTENKETQLKFSRNVNNPFVVPFEGEKNEGVYKNENGNRSLSMDYDSGFSNGKNEQGNWGAVSSSNVYLERSSSAVSDYRGTFHKGVSTSDAGSHSSGLSSQQDKNPPTTDHPFEQLEGNDSSSPTEPQVSRKVRQLSEDSSQTKNKRSTSVDPTSHQTKERSGDVIKQRPPRPSNQNQVTVSVPHMPCVSTKGNGPNGRTIMGFLYKYTKSEISIMCVCHGTSFSPAGFVEHAGCVDIENPLRHITVVPSV